MDTPNHNFALNWGQAANLRFQVTLNMVLLLKYLNIYDYADTGHGTGSCDTQTIFAKITIKCRVNLVVICLRNYSLKWHLTICAGTPFGVNNTSPLLAFYSDSEFLHYLFW